MSTEKIFDAIMLDINELWIGDLLRIKEDGRRATFEGQINGQLKIRVGDKFIVVDADALEIAPAEKEAPEPMVQESRSFDPLNFETHLDLHLESLDPSRKNDSPIQIRAYQIRRCREFLENALRLKIREVTIIHGKGEGVLKADVINLLSEFPEITSIEELHQGGAQRIRF